MVAATVDWTILATVGGIVVVAMILAFLLARRDPNVGRTRIGFFVERERFGEPEDPWPNLTPSLDQRTLPQWTPEKPFDQEEKK